jgi:hypothetical protein
MKKIITRSGSVYGQSDDGERVKQFSGTLSTHLAGGEWSQARSTSPNVGERWRIFYRDGMVRVTTPIVSIEELV